MRYICRCEAVQLLMDTAMVLNTNTLEMGNLVRLYAEKFVDDVLDYCHRDDFPKALVYVGAEFIVKWATAQSERISDDVRMECGAVFFVSDASGNQCAQRG